MVCQWPSARSLSQARSEGAWRENLAKADMSASAKAISVSPTRLSGRLAKPLCTKRKSASAERCLRPCGATMDMENPITRRSNRSSQGVFSHRCLRKASSADTVITGLGGSSGIAGDRTSFVIARSEVNGAIICTVTSKDRVKIKQTGFRASSLIDTVEARGHEQGVTDT